MANQKTSFGLEETTITRTNLFAGILPPVTTPGVIAQGEVALAEGTVLGIVTASGKYAAYDDTATDGTETAVAILASATDAATTGDIPVTVYRTGEFNKASLAGIDAAAIVDLAAQNIYVKEVE